MYLKKKNKENQNDISNANSNEIESNVSEKKNKDNQNDISNANSNEIESNVTEKKIRIIRMLYQMLIQMK